MTQKLWKSHISRLVHGSQAWDARASQILLDTYVVIAELSTISFKSFSHPIARLIIYTCSLSLISSVCHCVDLYNTRYVSGLNLHRILNEIFWCILCICDFSTCLYRNAAVQLFWHPSLKWKSNCDFAMPICTLWSNLIYILTLTNLHICVLKLSKICRVQKTNTKKIYFFKKCESVRKIFPRLWAFRHTNYLLNLRYY